MKHFQEWLTAAFANHKGKKVGFLCGLIFGILILTLGFWRYISPITVSLGAGWAASMTEKISCFLERSTRQLRNKMPEAPICQTKRYL